MDLPTSYGTRLLSPFSWRWFAIDLMPIIDIYLLDRARGRALVGSGSRSIARDGADESAAVVLALMAANYGIRAVAHQQALSMASRRLRSRVAGAVRSIGRIRIAARLVAASRRTGPAHAASSDTAAIPIFASPFEWRVIAQLPDAYECTDQRPRRATADADAHPESSGRRARPNRGRRCRARHADRAGPAGILAVSRRAGRRRAVGRRRRSSSRTCASPMGPDEPAASGAPVRRCSRRPSGHRARRRRDRSSETTSGTVSRSRLGAHMSVAGGLPRAVERAVVHRLRGVSDLQQERQPVARPRACPRRRFASFARRSRRPGCTRSSRMPAT